MCFVVARCVAHQTASCSVLTPPAYGRDRIPAGKSRDLTALVKKYRIGPDRNCTCTLCYQLRKRCIDLVLITRACDDQFQSKRSCRILKCLAFSLVECWIVRICE